MTPPGTIPSDAPPADGSLPDGSPPDGSPLEDAPPVGPGVGPHLRARLRPLQALVHDAVDATTYLVEEGHSSAARAVVRPLAATLGAEPVEAVDAVRRVITSGVLKSVRLVNRAVEHVSNAALDLAGAEAAPVPAVPLRADVLMSTSGALDQLVGVLNGAVGDHLSRANNGLCLGMHARHGERWLDEADCDLSDVNGRIVVLVHGLATTELSWCLGTDKSLGDGSSHFGGLLEAEQGFTPIYLRYNTGRPVRDNGAELSRLLHGICQDWPVPVEQIVLIGHSMGGLICRAASQLGQPWVYRLSHLVCLGSPHQGAPLARLGQSAADLLENIDLPATRIVGRILANRSAGVKDLGHRELDSTGPLLEHVSYLFVAGSLGPLPDHPRAPGDLLVPVDSASGPPGDHSARVQVVRLGSVAHHQLQTHPAVYQAVAQALSEGGAIGWSPTEAPDGPSSTD